MARMLFGVRSFLTMRGRGARLHGLDSLFHQFGKIPAQALGTLSNNLTRAAGGELLILELFLERFDRQIINALGGTHQHRGAKSGR